MSIKVMSWAWEQELPPLTKLILMAIADHADDSGYAWPGYRGIAKKCGASYRTIQRHVHSLEEQGILKVEPRQRPDGSSSSNGYTVVMNVTIRDEGVSESLPPTSESHPGWTEVTPLDDTPVTPLTVIEPSEETTTTNESIAKSLADALPKVMESARNLPPTTEPLTLLEVFDDPEWLVTLAEVEPPDYDQRTRIIRWARNRDVVVLTQVAYNAAASWEKYKKKNKSLYNTFMNWVNMQEKRDSERGAPADVLPRSQQDKYGAEAYIQNQGLHPSSEQAKKIRREWSNGVREST